MCTDRPWGHRPFIDGCVISDILALIVYPGEGRRMKEVENFYLSDVTRK